MLATVPSCGVIDDDRAAFRANGFLTIPDLCDAAEAERLRSIMVDLRASEIGTTTGDRSDLIGDVGRDGTVLQITHLERYTGRLAGSPVRERAFAIARALIGDDAVLDCETLIVKEAGSPDATPWHQDEAFWPAGTTRDAISIWIALQDTTLAGGCMQFVPGSHRGEVLAHRPLPGVLHANAFEAADADTRHHVVCPLPSGGATVHHARTLHASGPNATPVPRYAYILVFSGPRSVLPQPRPFTWQGERARDDHKRAAFSGLNGLVNRAVRTLSVAVARLNALNDRRNWTSGRSRRPLPGRERV